MPKFYLPSSRPPANGVSPRPVPGPMAPERCVMTQPCVSPHCTVLVGRDLQGVVRVKVELATEDISSWWLKVIRHWLAWHYGAADIKLIR